MFSDDGTETDSLPNHSSFWMSALQQSLTLEGRPSNRVRGWLVFRGRVDDLRNRIVRSNKSGSMQGHKIVLLSDRPFGTVSVANIEFRKTATGDREELLDGRG